jgi:hypothetical protein
MAKQKGEVASKIPGAKEADPDHPIFSEGPSIVFLSHRPKRSEQKDKDSTPGVLESFPDTQ